MAKLLTEHEELTKLLFGIKTIALVGASEKSDRPSYEVMDFLIKKGFKVYPVNPRLSGYKLLDQPVYKTLSDIPLKIDMVDVFRNSDAVSDILNEVLCLHPLPRVFWTQLGVVNKEAAELALRNGIDVVMNHCPKIELSGNH